MYVVTIVPKLTMDFDDNRKKIGMASLRFSLPMSFIKEFQKERERERKRECVCVTNCFSSDWTRTLKLYYQFASLLLTWLSRLYISKTLVQLLCNSRHSWSKSAYVSCENCLYYFELPSQIGLEHLYVSRFV